MWECTWVEHGDNIGWDSQDTKPGGREAVRVPGRAWECYAALWTDLVVRSQGVPPTDVSRLDECDIVPTAWEGGQRFTIGSQWNIKPRILRVRLDPILVETRP